MNRVPFGLSTSPFVYQKLMNKLLTGYQFIFACAYLDDLIIYSNKWSSHLQHMRLILNRIQQSGLRLRPDKCKFAQSEIKYLGMILSKDKIKPDPEKLRVIKNAKPPTSAKLLKSFLGLCGFYRRMIRGFSQICHPFRALLKKGAPFIWTEDHDKDFDRLKKAMTSAPVFIHVPNWNEKIVLLTDGSRHGCGYIIANEDDKGVQKVIAYGGRQWTKHESMWSTTEFEMASILYALETNSQYFIGRRFKIYTDHISNTWVQNLKFSQGRLHRWSLRLQNYLFDIYHLPGSKMPADYISRATDKIDNKTNNLEDDSALVFNVAAVCDEPNVDYPQVRRSGRRHTTIITIPTRCDDPHENESSAQQTDEPLKHKSYTHNSSVHPASTGNPDCSLTASTNTAHSSTQSLHCQQHGYTGSKSHKTVGIADTELCGNTAPIATVTDATVITPSANAAQPMRVHAEDGSPVQQQLASLVELQSTPNMAELQRQTPDLANIICYLQTGQLPLDKQLAKRIVCDADNWYITRWHGSARVF